MYADTTTYPGSTSNLARVAPASDNVVGDNTTAQIAQTFTGRVAAGYAATAVIGLAR